MYIYVYIYIIYNYHIYKMELQVWFSENQMKGNTDKFHLLMTKDESSKIHIGESINKSSDCERLLGIQIDLMIMFKINVKRLKENYKY